jgi:trehalose 6-phosphate phosphatase
MVGMELTSDDARQRYADLVAVLGSSVVGLDFDGTLSPIVEDPTRARIHPEAAAVLEELAAHVAAIAVITGRPAGQVLELGGLDDVGEAIGRDGRALLVLGQYGNERWSSTDPRIVSPRPPRGLAGFLDALPGLLHRLGLEAAYVEEKGLAVAVHTRRLPDPRTAYDALLPALAELADDHGLSLEPGRQVVEVRAPGMDKGQALRTVVAETGAGGVLFAGDDLGDLEAFAAVEELRDQGLPTLLVCSVSDEESALAARADVLVDGPDGVLDLLRRLVRDATSSAG